MLLVQIQEYKKNPSYSGSLALEDDSAVMIVSGPMKGDVFFKDSDVPTPPTENVGDSGNLSDIAKTYEPWKN
jgi:hypothetical protein